jgi:diguanylate cyclase (GGDEF)-like protein
MKYAINFHTLKGRMRLLVYLSVGLVVLMGSFSLWRLSLSQKQNVATITASAEMQDNLQNNFKASSLLGRIQANLRLFMRSANQVVLANIRNDVEVLASTVPKNQSDQISHLLEIVDILALRMESLQSNNTQIPEAEERLGADILAAQESLPAEVFSEVFILYSKGIRSHQKIYVSSLISGRISQIEANLEKLSTILGRVDEQLALINKKLPSEQQAYVQKLRDGFYWLDEAGSTVAAIRVVTLKTEKDIIQTVSALETATAQDSLGKNTESFLLTKQGLAMARKNALFLMSVMLLLAGLFILTSVYISRNMIQPLVDFVGLLRKLGTVMAGLRQGGNTDDEQVVRLSAIGKNRQDEIGEVARAIKDMLARIHAVSFFRQTIEADESTAEIYIRLARIFVGKFGLDMFVIYEKLRGQDSMEPAYCEPVELATEVPEFSTACNCRAQRTGTIVTSYDDPDLCPVFPFPQCLDHYCIPMIVGGHIIGVVQFLFRMSISETEKKDILNRVIEAKNFIAETLPVLQSKHLAMELEEMATKDQLTGLFNRRYLESSLDQLVAGVKRRGATMGILMCDLDFFKKVNDTHGHDAGDAVLSQLAQVLCNAVRESDLVVRFGGEEFLIFLVDCDPGKAANIAENIRASVEKYKFQGAGKTIEKTTSIGVTEFPFSEGQGIWEAIKFADVALYKAKENGRNRVEVFDQDMWEESSY